MEHIKRDPVTVALEQARRISALEADINRIQQLLTDTENDVLMRQRWLEARKKEKQEKVTQLLTLLGEIGKGATGTPRED